MAVNNLGEIIQQCVNETALAFFVDDCEILPGPVVVKEDEHPYKPPEADLVAIVGFSGQIEGGTHLSAPIHVAVGLASAFMGEAIQESDEELGDSFGELANIIAGAVKDHISEEISLTPPVVFKGAASGIQYTSKLESTKCYFRSRFGPFFVEVFHRLHATQIVISFKKEHAELIEAFESIKKFGIEQREGVRAFWKSENLLVNHLINEDNNMYPLLKKAAESDPGLKEIVQQFSAEMSNIVDKINHFSKDLIAAEEASDHTGLSNELAEIGKILTRRIKLEEAVIYPAFEKIETDKQKIETDKP